MFRLVQDDVLTWARDYNPDGDPRWRFHAVLCDPPYGLEFMGKKFDSPEGFEESLQHADGFRRADNPADVGRENVFGRTSRTSPEYRTGHWKTGAGFSSPGIGERETEWPSFSGNSQFGGANPTCHACGGRLRGKKKCECETPDWYVDGQSMNVASKHIQTMRTFQEWCFAWATAIMPHLHPGAFVFAFGGTRTVHRLTCALEDAGLEIRDCVAFCHGQGFPKSRDIWKNDIRSEVEQQLRAQGVDGQIEWK